MVQDCEPLDLQHPSPSTIAEVLILSHPHTVLNLAVAFIENWVRLTYSF